MRGACATLAGGRSSATPRLGLVRTHPSISRTARKHLANEIAIRLHDFLGRKICGPAPAHGCPSPREDRDTGSGEGFFRAKTSTSPGGTRNPSMQSRNESFDAIHAIRDEMALPHDHGFERHIRETFVKGSHHNKIRRRPRNRIPSHCGPRNVQESVMPISAARRLTESLNPGLPQRSTIEPEATAQQNATVRSVQQTIKDGYLILSRRSFLQTTLQPVRGISVQPIAAARIRRPCQPRSGENYGTVSDEGILPYRLLGISRSFSRAAIHRKGIVEIDTRCRG